MGTTLLSANIEVNGLLKKESKESSKCQRANRKQQLIKGERVVSMSLLLGQHRSWEEGLVIWG